MGKKKVPRAPPAADAPARNTRSRKIDDQADRSSMTTAPTTATYAEAVRSGRSTEAVGGSDETRSSFLTPITSTPSPRRWADEDPDIEDELPDINEFINATSSRSSAHSSDAAERGREGARIEGSSPDTPALSSPRDAHVDEQRHTYAPNTSSISTTEVLSPNEREQRKNEKRPALQEEAPSVPSEVSLDTVTRAYIDTNFPREAAQRLRLRIRDEHRRRGRPLTADDIEGIIEEGLQEVIHDRVRPRQSETPVEDSVERLEQLREHLKILYRPRMQSEDDEEYLKRLDLQRAREEEYLAPRGSSDRNFAAEWAAVREISRSSLETRQTLQKLRLTDIEATGHSTIPEQFIQFPEGRSGPAVDVSEDAMMGPTISVEGLDV
ncbi:hypothetical protein GGG16DRAFT_109479 [Schizophyllum commune]